jgi:hypothetical protein
MNEARPLHLPIRLILSKWFFIVYFALSLVCFSALPLLVSWIGLAKSFFLTLALMTGSDPYSFKEIIEPHGFIWGLAWLIHLASWLLIPAIIALVITEAKEDIKKDQVLRTRVRELLLRSGVSEEDLADATTAFLSEIEAFMDQPIKKGA